MDCYFVPQILLPFLVPTKLPRFAYQGLYYMVETDDEGHLTDVVDIELERCALIARLRQTRRAAAANVEPRLYLQDAKFRQVACRYHWLLMGCRRGVPIPADLLDPCELVGDKLDRDKTWLREKRRAVVEVTQTRSYAVSIKVGAGYLYHSEHAEQLQTCDLVAGGAREKK